MISFKSLSDQFTLWEFLSPGIYIEGERLKQLNAEKHARSKILSKLKTLDKVVQMIDKLKDEKDVPKIEQEYSKFTAQVEKEQQAQQEKL